jgi:hypothetical protein
MKLWHVCGLISLSIAISGCAPRLIGSGVSAAAVNLSQGVTVTPSIPTGLVTDPSTSLSVAAGTIQTFNVTAQNGYGVSQNVGGTCPQGT